MILLKTLEISEAHILVKIVELCVILCVVCFACRVEIEHKTDLDGRLLLDWKMVRCCMSQ